MLSHPSQSASSPQYLTVAEVATMLRVTDRHVRKLIAGGKIPAVKVAGTSIRIRTADVDAIITPVATGLEVA